MRDTNGCGRGGSACDDAEESLHDHDVRPEGSLYFDEADVREELTRVYQLCHGCRRCVELCASFPTLFEMIDATTTATPDG
jgi:glycerol-3-phosphate dehydrogenase subunit C